MKKTVLILCLVVVGFYSCDNGEQDADDTAVEATAKQDTAIREYKTSEHTYTELREMAFNTSPQDLGLDPNPNYLTAYGVIMEMGKEEGTMTLTAFVSGDASIYLSTGGGVIGGVGHDNVRAAASDLIQKAQENVRIATTKTEENELPAVGEVKFYICTNKGRYVGTEKIQKLENGSSELQPLFEKANRLITEIRTKTELR